MNTGQRCAVSAALFLALLLAVLAPPLSAAGDPDQPQGLTSELPPLDRPLAQPIVLRGIFQTRYALNTTNGQPGSDLVEGFETTRLLLITEADPIENVHFFALTSLGPLNRVRLIDAFINYKLGNGFTVRAGQHRLVFNREFAVGVAKQLGMDRTVLGGTLGVGRSQFVSLKRIQGRSRAEISLSEGSGLINTSFDSQRTANFAVTARGEYLLVGDDFGPFRDFTSFPGSDNAVMLGFGARYEDGDNGRPDVAALVVDASYEGDGVNAFASVYVNESRDAGDRFTDWGLTVQGGRFITQHDELFARYAAIIGDPDRNRDEVFHEITLGANRYVIPESYAVRLSAELSWFPADQSETIARPGVRTGVLPSSDGQLLARVQVQLLF